MIFNKYFLTCVFLLIVTIHASAKPHPDRFEAAEKIYQRMTLEEKLGQMLLPTYRLLATAVHQPSGKSPGYLCQQAVNNSQTPVKQIIRDCGLDQIAKYKVGAVLADGGPYYNSPSLKNWQDLNVRAIQVHKHGVASDPLLLIGNDAIHGNNHISGAVIFPHDINLGATHDPKLIQNIGELVADDVLASGFNWAYMPTVAVAQDSRWGRFYESFAQDPVLVKEFSHSYIAGFQHPNNGKIKGVMASVKHFLGDGGTQYGLDEGDAIFKGNQAQFWKIHGLGYEGALDAGAVNLMVSYSAINGDRMHFGGPWNIINAFKTQGIQGSKDQRYIFRGFTVSDYNGPTRAAYFYNLKHPSLSLNTLPEIFAKAINSGVDMIMLGNSDTKNPFDSNSPLNYASVGEACEALKTAYTRGLITEEKLKEVVVRILAAKLAMSPQISTKTYAKLQEKERAVALKAAEESIVLLKNNSNILPLQKNAIKNIIFIGETNDLGIQNGGWTINWQGQKGSTYFEGKDQLSSGAHTIEQALMNKLKQESHFYHHQDIPNIIQNLSSKDTIAIAVIAEPPYAEYMGDIGNTHEVDKWYEKGSKADENRYMPKTQSQELKLVWSDMEAQAIQQLREKKIPIVTIVYSGRPIVLSEGGVHAPLETSDAVLAAFLPGTRGGDALANILVGDYRLRSNKLSNTLSFPWPRNMQDVIDHFANGALYPVGFGLG